MHKHCQKGQKRSPGRFAPGPDQKAQTKAQLTGEQLTRNENKMHRIQNIRKRTRAFKTMKTMECLH